MRWDGGGGMGRDEEGCGGMRRGEEG